MENDLLEPMTAVLAFIFIQRHLESSLFLKIQRIFGLLNQLIQQSKDMGRAAQIDPETSPSNLQGCGSRLSY
jgi:hypothetical protein